MRWAAHIDSGRPNERAGIAIRKDEHPELIYDRIYFHELIGSLVPLGE
jgi:hypothetical protein